ncbi:IS4/IS5 family transposase, partial [[Clostridium] clostridioforme]|nr:IS4/IS5 family transposase [Enterocloster clostridioformis]
KMMINRTLSIGILKNDLIYILLERDEEKQDRLFHQIYEDISKNLVPIRPDRHYHRTKGQLAGKYSNTHKRAY